MTHRVIALLVTLTLANLVAPLAAPPQCRPPAARAGPCPRLPSSPPTRAA
jgi:hypothetical protein